MKKEKFIARIKKGRKDNRPLCFAHRGASGLVDGILPAVVMASKMDVVDGIEFDVQQTKDGHLIVRHDFTVDVGKKNLWVREVTFKTLRENTRIEDSPELSQVLSELKHCDKILDIEIKQPGIFPKAYRLLKESGLYDQAVFTTLYREIYDEVKKIAPEAACSYGYPRDRGKNLSGQRWAQPFVKLVVAFMGKRINSTILKIMKEYDTPFISLYNKVITKEVVDIIHKHNRYCIGNTINLRNDTLENQTMDAMIAMLSQGCDIIKTDYPNIYPDALAKFRENSS